MTNAGFTGGCGSDKPGDGIRAPSREISSNEQSGRTIVEDETIEVNIQLDDDFFSLTPPEE